jgi:hypothetical protein
MQAVEGKMEASSDNSGGGSSSDYYYQLCGYDLVLDEEKGLYLPARSQQVTNHCQRPGAREAEGTVCSDGAGDVGAAAAASGFTWLCGTHNRDRAGAQDGASGSDSTTK